MIDLVFSKGNVFVWSANDWLKLRRHRIMGELIGCLSKLPRQRVFPGLPLLLAPEEVTLLLDKKMARLVEIPSLQEKPNDDLKLIFEAYRQNLLVEQEQSLKEGRKKQIGMVMDKIVEGKRRKILGLNTSKKKMKKALDDNTTQKINEIEIDQDALLSEQMKKFTKLDPAEAVVQIHTAYPWCKKDDVREVTWNYPLSAEDKLKSRVFQDLWDKGFYVLNGEKFGCDFMVYPGDPIMFHSQFQVDCKDRNEDITILDLSAQCRLACHVRKTLVYAYLSEDGTDLKYQSFQYENSSINPHLIEL